MGNRDLLEQILNVYNEQQLLITEIIQVFNNESLYLEDVRSFLINNKNFQFLILKELNNLDTFIVMNDLAIIRRIVFSEKRNNKEDVKEFFVA